ncbi:MAG: efflux RND transporter periplasmic adaptor subunit [Woeseiaceae bacterium]
MPYTISKTLLIAALALLGLQGCGTGEASVAEEDAREATPVPVSVAYSQREDIFATYEVNATLASDADAPVVARVSGELVALLVEEGDLVKRGQPLATLDGKKLRLEMLAARASLEQASKEHERNVDLHRRGLISTATVDDLKFNLEALQASYALKKLYFDYATIRAPIDGVISAREVKVGQTIDVDQVILRVTDTAVLQAELQVPQSELPKFSAGDLARLTVASMPESEFVATVARISPTIDKRNGTFRATAVIDNASGELAPGMFAKFSVAYEIHKNALLVPAAAVVAEDEEATVYVVEGGTVTRRSVEVGITSNGHAEILEGLRDGEQVVVVGHSGLRDGSKVLAGKEQPARFTG